MPWGNLSQRWQFVFNTLWWIFLQSNFPSALFTLTSHFSIYSTGCLSSHLHAAWGSTSSLRFGFELDTHYCHLMPYLLVLERMGIIPTCFFYDSCEFIGSAVVCGSWGGFLSDWKVLVILVVPHLKVAPYIWLSSPTYSPLCVRLCACNEIWSNPQCHHSGETCPQKKHL